MSRMFTLVSGEYVPVGLNTSPNVYTHINLDQIIKAEEWGNGGGMVRFSDGSSISLEPSAFKRLLESTRSK